MTQVLYFVHAGVLLLFGVYISAIFSGILLTKKNIAICFGFCIGSGFLQILSYLYLSPNYVWKLYPVITHIPLFLLLGFVFQQRAITAISAISTAYLCCQPAKWFGVLIFTLTQNRLIEYIIRICLLCALFAVIYFYLGENMSEIFHKDTRSVCIFGITPIIYYLFDYIVAIYTDFWTSYSHITADFLAFFLCIIFLIFCLIYYKEYEQKANAQQKEQMIRLIIEEQKKELEAVNRSEHEVRILRHDMRLFLRNLSLCIDNDDKTTAQKMISSYIDNVDATTVKKYCNNPTINYVISAFSKKCDELQIELIYHIDIEELNCDEIIFSSIISNALDNAVNAQQYVPVAQRKIELMLKNLNGKLLFSIQNPFRVRPVLSNGIPVTVQKGHGYGSKSILYLTERMGGVCQFKIDGNSFIVRVVI